MYDRCRSFGILALRGLLLLALASGALSAWASFPATNNPAGWEYSVNGVDWTPDVNAACQQWVGILDQGDINSSGKYITSAGGYLNGDGTPACSIMWTNPPPAGGRGVLAARREKAASTTCPANSTLSGGMCTCTAPSTQNPSNDGCSVVDSMDQLCKNAKILHHSTLGIGNGPVLVAGQHDSGFYCNAEVPGAEPGRGCSVEFKTDMQGSSDGVNWRTWGSFSMSGTPCTVGPDGPPTPTEVPSSMPSVTPTVPGCKPPKIEGSASMNGATVKLCNDPIVTKTPEEKEVDKKDPGTPQEVTTETKKETTCTGSSCVTKTTVTTKNATGETTSTSTSEKTTGKAGFCEANPKNNNCTGEAGGGCPAGASTVGCTLLGTPQDGEVPKSEVNVSTFAPDNLSGFAVPAKACPTDLAFSAFGQSFTLEYKPICDAAPYVKPAVLLAAALASLMIVYAALTAKN